MPTPTPHVEQAGDITIATISKNSRAELRIALSEYRGHNLVQIREWYPGDDGEWRPGRGASFKVALLPAVVDGINRALERARRDGLIG